MIINATSVFLEAKVSIKRKNFGGSFYFEHFHIFQVDILSIKKKSKFQLWTFKILWKDRHVAYETDKWTTIVDGNQDSGREQGS